MSPRSSSSAALRSSASAVTSDESASCALAAFDATPFSSDARSSSFSANSPTAPSTAVVSCVANSARSSVACASTWPPISSRSFSCAALRSSASAVTREDSVSFALVDAAMRPSKDSPISATALSTAVVIRVANSARSSVACVSTRVETSFDTSSSWSRSLLSVSARLAASLEAISSASAATRADAASAELALTSSFSPISANFASVLASLSPSLSFTSLTALSTAVVNCVAISARSSVACASI